MTTANVESCLNKLSRLRCDALTTVKSSSAVRASISPTSTSFNSPDDRPTTCDIAEAITDTHTVPEKLPLGVCWRGNSISVMAMCQPAAADGVGEGGLTEAEGEEEVEREESTAGGGEGLGDDGGGADDMRG